MEAGQRQDRKVGSGRWEGGRHSMQLDEERRKKWPDVINGGRLSRSTVALTGPRDSAFPFLVTCEEEEHNRRGSDSMVRKLKLDSSSCSLSLASNSWCLCISSMLEDTLLTEPFSSSHSS